MHTQMCLYHKVVSQENNSMYIAKCKYKAEGNTVLSVALWAPSIPVVMPKASSRKKHKKFNFIQKLDKMMILLYNIVMVMKNF